MWFELIDTAIAAAGLGVATIPLFKKNLLRCRLAPIEEMDT
ncbi:hypothetical protein [uncultured Tateyamaria sp.]|nr:hypothetical protein [uncultured Tateyamaria sp.]